MFSHRKKNIVVKWELHTDMHNLPTKVGKYFVLIENIHLVPTGIDMSVIGRMYPKWIHYSCSVDFKIICAFGKKR